MTLDFNMAFECSIILNSKGVAKKIQFLKITQNSEDIWDILVNWDCWGIWNSLNIWNNCDSWDIRDNTSYIVKISEIVYEAKIYEIVILW